MKISKLKSLYLRSDAHKEAFIYMNVPRIQRSKEQICLKLLRNYGVEIKKRIPLITVDHNFGDNRIGVEHDKGYLYICRYTTPTGESITFGYYPNRYFVFEKNTYSLGKYLALRLCLKEQNKLPRPVEKSVKSIVDEFKEFLSTEYINEHTQTQIVNAITPYISTFKLRKSFDVNMCLSIVFTGEPGDGKTYIGNRISSWISSYLRITHVAEEVTVFEKAAKLVEDFVAVIDDMNVAHFRRDGIGGVICQNILSEMDKPSCNRLFFLTTNEAVNETNIDRAFFRPGRIQSIVVFKRPNEELKKRIIDDMHKSLVKNKFEISIEFLTGIKLFVSEDHDLSLAEMMRLKNLIITDIIMEKELSHPKLYVSRCKKLKVKEGEEAHVTTV